MNRRFFWTTDAKKDHVAEALADNRTKVVAKRHGITPDTLDRWVNRKYKGKVNDIVAKKRNEEQRIKKATEKLPEGRNDY